MACTGCLNLQLVDSRALVDVFLPRLLPQAWQGQAVVTWSAGADGAPSAEWIVMLWQELQVTPPSQHLCCVCLRDVPSKGCSLVVHHMPIIVW